MLLQGGIGGERVIEVLAALVLLAGGLAHPAGVGHMVSPVLPDALEHLAVLVVEIHLFTGIVAVMAGLLVTAGGGFLETDVVHGHLFQGRIGLQFLLDGGAEIQGGDLEDLE